MYKQNKRQKSNDNNSYLNTIDTDDEFSDEDNDSSSKSSSSSSSSNNNNSSNNKQKVNVSRSPQTKKHNQTIHHSTYIQTIKSTYEKDRNKIIQTEIKQQQTETIRLERQWKQKAQLEISKIQSIQEEEEKQYSKRIHQLNTEISEIITDREDNLQKIKLLENKNTVKSENINKIENEIQIIRNKIQFQRAQIISIKSDKNQNIQNSISTLQQSILQMQQRLQDVRQQIEVRDKETARVMSELKSRHEEDLRELDYEVSCYL